MRFQIQHFTRYEYSVPVSLATHTLRLLPQVPQDAVEYHRLDIDPVPSNRWVEIDSYGNRVLRVEFVGQTQCLFVDSQLVVTVTPPQVLTDPGLPALPWFNFSDALPAGGAPWQEQRPIAENVHAFAQGLAAEAGHHAISFLELLSRTLYQRMDRQIRIEGQARTASETLSTLQGACRDITVLYLECCRAVGIVGRFVSGYQSAADTPDGQRHLHAWPEVYLPWVGWRGWDATHGIAVVDGHLPLSRAVQQAETMPVSGSYSFIGPSLSSTLSYGVRIRTD